MNDNIVDLTARRMAKDVDYNCAANNDDGRPYFLFNIEWQFEERAFGGSIWAHDFEDAAVRVEAMKISLVLGNMVTGHSGAPDMPDPPE